jgi:uncharacterized membrane protein YeaQ/YmgE (transglycosylase-associated protein family)
MNPSTLLLGIIIAVLYGVLYHLLRGGGFWRLILFIVLSVAGFALGHFIGTMFGLSFAALGSLNLGMATIGSVLFLLLGDWLIRIRPSRESKV